jgi:hypothetical protein
MANYDRYMRLMFVAIVIGSLCIACGGDDDAAGNDTTTTATAKSVTTETATTSTETPKTSTTEKSKEKSKNKGKPTLDRASSLSTVGLDTVTFGMTVKQAEKAAGTEMVPEAAPNADCYWVTPTEAPKGIRFMVSEGTIERVDIVAGPITTRSGIGIGTPVERVIELFGDQVDPSADGATLVFVPSDASDSEFRVIFETDTKVVTSLRSGRVPQVTSPDCGL